MKMVKKRPFCWIYANGEELWEDFYDVLVSHSKAKEKSDSWAELESELDAERPNHGSV